MHIFMEYSYLKMHNGTTAVHPKSQTSASASLLWSKSHKHNVLIKFSRRKKLGNIIIVSGNATCLACHWMARFNHTTIATSHFGSAKESQSTNSIFYFTFLFGGSSVRFSLSFISGNITRISVFLLVCIFMLAGRASHLQWQSTNSNLHMPCERVLCVGLVGAMPAFISIQGREKKSDENFHLSHGWGWDIVLKWETMTIFLFNFLSECSWIALKHCNGVTVQKLCNAGMDYLDESCLSLSASWFSERCRAIQFFFLLLFLH